MNIVDLLMIVTFLGVFTLAFWVGVVRSLAMLLALTGGVLGASIACGTIGSTLVSRIASMSRSVDRELLASSEFYAGLDAAGRRYLVSTGRYALRGIGRAQDLYTLDPEVDSSEPVTGSYERYLAN